MNRLSGGHFALLGLTLALVLACSPAPNILPSNDFNRPTDLAFMCLGAFGDYPPALDDKGNPTDPGPYRVSGRPMRACQKPPVKDVKEAPLTASIHNRTFAFVPNSASGDLSVVDANNWKIVDLNKGTGGFGRVPLGALPEQISTTSDGCRLMSANRGSCDLSLVDPSTLLAGVFNAQYGNVTVPPGNGVQRVVPHWPGGPELAAAPYEAVFLPEDTQQLNGNEVLCEARSTPWRALVTFPSCNLVALIDMPSGTIQAWAQADPVGPKGQETVTFRSGTDHPDCPVDCRNERRADAGTDPANSDAGAGPDGDSDAGAGPDADSDAGADPDGGAGDGGTSPLQAASPTTLVPQPTSIAITPRADHAYVSFANVPAIFSLGLSPTTLTRATPQSIALNEGAEGSNRIRLGVDPYVYTDTMKGADGKDVTVYNYAGGFVGRPNRAYLYAIARDGSLRIIDVSVPGYEQECATNFDPLVKTFSPDTACIPFKDAPRRQYSIETAGLRFPSMPIDVAAADLSGPSVEDTVNGGYAWVLTANGSIYLVNIDPIRRDIKAVVHKDQNVLFEPLTPTVAANPFVVRADPLNGGLVTESPPFPNRPRDRNVMSFSQSLDPALGPARVDLPPLGLPTGPYIEPLWTQGTEDNATALDVEARQTYVFFPDREAVIAQGWDVTYQGTIVSPRYSGILHGAELRDGAGFCAPGVLRGDIVTLLGCTNPAQCPTGMTCQRDPTLDMVEGGFTVTGLCVSASQPSLADRCKPYFSAVRRYEIVDARNSHVTLVPHLDEVVRSSVSPCEIVAETTGTGGATGTAGATGTGGAAGTGGVAGMGGAAGMGGGAGTGGTAAPDHAKDCLDPSDGSTNRFKCVDYWGQRRCLDPCTTNQECRAGRVCHTPTCTDLSQCPQGAKACTNGVCFTDLACNPQRSCEPSQSCQPNPDKNDTAKPTICAFDNRSFCADGPPLKDDACFPQLTAYHVSANGSFVVTGAQAGSFSAGTDDGYETQCRAFTAAERDPRLVSRIPLRPAPVAPDKQPAAVACAAMADQTTDPLFPTNQTTSPPADGYYFDRFDPALKPTIIDGKAAVERFTNNGAAASATPEAPQLVKWMKDWSQVVSAPNACLYLGGPLDSDRPHNADPTTRPDRLPHTRARFRNTQIAFVLANIDRAPATNATLHFDVHGGFRMMSVNSLLTVEVSAPARLILGPIDSNNKETTVTTAAPYFFVVDQRRLGRGQGGGATRGQIVRVNPYGQPTSIGGLLPTYEDYMKTGGLFPIQ